MQALFGRDLAPLSLRVYEYVRIPLAMQALFGPISILTIAIMTGKRSIVRIPLAMQALFGPFLFRSFIDATDGASGYPLLCKPFSDFCLFPDWPPGGQSVCDESKIESRPDTPCYASPFRT